MEKRKRSVSLSFVLLRFACMMLGLMLFCALLWLAIMQLLQTTGFIDHGSLPNRQAEAMLLDHPETFTTPGEDFLSDYALFAADGSLLETNTDSKEAGRLSVFLTKDSDDPHIIRYIYADQSTILIHWVYQRDFTDPQLRKYLPPFEVLWWITLFLAFIFVLLLSVLLLRRSLTSKLKLFHDISNKITSQELDFAIFPAGIREFDDALAAMDEMRRALYDSLTEQWRTQQQREAEISALAHDLKTPLTLIGGNAELLLCENLPENQNHMLHTILENTTRAHRYLSGLLDASTGNKEPKIPFDLSALLPDLVRSMEPFAGMKHISLHMDNHLTGFYPLQKDHFSRALSNIVQNALEHTPPGKQVSLIGRTSDTGWELLIFDEGMGFSPAALRHATERLWRDDPARQADGHNGIGLWFAAEVVHSHGGTLTLENRPQGGMVKILLNKSF